MEFFNENAQTTQIQQKAIHSIRSMPEADIELILKIIERIKGDSKQSNRKHW